MDDKVIINLYNQRDESAIIHTEQKYGRYCQRIALNLLNVHEDAEECVNDTYLAVWNRIPPDRPISLKTFLGRITRNLAISRWRMNHAQKRYAGIEIMLSELEECLPSNNNIEKSMEQKELNAVINEWLAMLPQNDRMLFIRRYWYGDTVKDLAKEWGMSAVQMAQYMQRLRRKLRKVLEGVIMV